MAASSSHERVPPAVVSGPLMLGVTAALPLEARAVRRGALLQVEITGIGAVQAAEGARRLVQAGAGALLSWGTAAGLVPDAPPGTIALPQEVIDTDGRRFPVDVDWHRRMVRRVSAPVAPMIRPLAASGALLRGAEDKRALHLRTGAAVADMESGAVARVAAEAGLPFLALRVVLDPDAGVLPACVGAAAGAGGELPLAKLLLSAATRPADWARLLRLAGWYREARRVMERVARQGAPDRFALQEQTPG